MGEMRKDLQDRHQQMTHGIFEVIEDSTNILGNQVNQQNQWLDSVLCAIYKQAGATSCEGSGQSLLDLVVDWPTDSAPLWNRLQRLEEKGGVIETKIDTQSTAFDTMKEEFDTMKEEMSGMKDKMSGMKDEMSGMKDEMSGMKDEIKDDMRAIKEMFAHFLEQNEK